MAFLLFVSVMMCAKDIQTIYGLHYIVIAIVWKQKDNSENNSGGEGRVVLDEEKRMNELLSTIYLIWCISFYLYYFRISSLFVLFRFISAHT